MTTEMDILDNGMELYPNYFAFSPNNPPMVQCPDGVVYYDHYIEINLWNMGKNWDFSSYLEMLSSEEPEEIMNDIMGIGPTGWAITGWEEYAHKDNNGVVTVYFEGDCLTCNA